MHTFFRPNQSTNTAPSTSTLSTQTQWISIEGKDARDFLHRLTSTDVKNLAPGQGARGFFLTAQGKIRSDFMLWCYAPDAFAFELQEGKDAWNSQALLQAIDQMTFAEQFVLTPLTPSLLDCVWFFISPIASAQALAQLGGLAPLETVATPNALRICHHGDRDFGRHWISIWARPQVIDDLLNNLSFEATPTDLATLNHHRIEAMRPWIDFEVTPEANPLELGLYDGIADQKGCYPGQEVIERTVSLGSPARSLCQLNWGTGVSTGVSHLPLEEDFGKITSVDSKGNLALGLIRKIQAQPGHSLTLKSGQQTQILKSTKQAPVHA